MNSKVQELLKELEKRIAKIDRAELMGLLMARTKHHHNYSISNMLIAGMQLCRQQGRSFNLEVFSNLWLAPFPVWNKWGYRVQRGAKALDILTPIKYKRESKQIKVVPDMDGKSENYSVYFTSRPVFDVSQTERPMKNDNALHRQTTINTATLSFAGLLSRIHNAGIKVEFLPLKEGLGGYIINNAITVNVNNTTEAQYATMLHELGHFCLGHTNANRIQSRSVEELEAEATAYVVGNQLGIEIPSEFYIAAWNGDGKAITKPLGNIDRAVKVAMTLLGIGGTEETNGMAVAA